ncbi:hypothetical protein [Elongatibacter sediminis]|uniref:Uncharacterized protein n=1 Tax=Elongatibacter sediminis TaxID=3119006 RepID=A0AAW9R7Q3_9GAMM
MNTKPVKQTIVSDAPEGRIVCMDSAYDVDRRNRDKDVVVTASYCGVLCARFTSQHHPRGVIGVDCGMGLEGSAIAGLWYYEALDLPAAAADINTVELGNGRDVYEHGAISRFNHPARELGVKEGMTVQQAAGLMLGTRTHHNQAPGSVTNRTVVHEIEGRSIVCTDSIAFALPEDTGRNVLCTGGHTGRSAVPYLRSARPLGFICSDGGGGRNRSGIAGLTIVERDGLAGATVDSATARMGDGLSTYRDGVISACNQHASDCGVHTGMTAREAALLLLRR